MSIYAVGGEADCFEPVSGQTYATETTSGRFEANASRGAMRITQASSELELYFPGGNVTEAYIHMYLYQEAVTTENDWIRIKTVANGNAFRIGLESDGRWSLYKYSGGSFGTALVTSASPVVVSGLATIDIYLKRHATTGEFSVYKDGTLVVSYTGDTTGDAANFGRIHWKGLTGATNELNLSQVIIASENTIGWKLQTNYPNSNSATNTAWTNDYTAVDEFAYDSGDYIETNSTGQVETYGATDINAAYATYNVKALVIATRASNDSGSAVADIQGALRVSATNYFSANLSLTKDSAEHSVQAIFETNPNTAAAWSQAAVNAAEIGLKSV